MAGGGVTRAVEHEAEGIIAKAAKDVLRDAERATARDAARDTARDTARAGERAAARDAGGDVIRHDFEKTSTALEHDVAVSGGRTRPRDIGEWETWADDEYARIRGDAADIDRIADHLEGTTLPDGTTVGRDEVAQVKSHLFDSSHSIEYQDGTRRVGRFDSDPEIAEAWNRLSAGEGTANDRLLLQHELAESRYLDSHPGATYNEAHAAANQHADWQQAIEGDG